MSESSPNSADGGPSSDATSEEGTRGGATETTSTLWWPDLDERWFIYPAYGATILGGGLAASFATGSPEWSAFPVFLGWGLLFVWYWLYGVAFRYRRPALKYLSLATAVGFGGLLTAFCVDRAVPQLAATKESVAVRGVSLTLVWAAVATGLGVAGIVLHAILFSRSRAS